VLKNVAGESVFGVFLISPDGAEVLQHLRALHSLMFVATKLPAVTLFFHRNSVQNCRFLFEFVYAVQSDHYLNLSEFTTSYSYAVQLLWKGQCPSSDTLCIEAPGVTWTMGRNVLYLEVLRRERVFQFRHL